MRNEVRHCVTGRRWTSTTSTLHVDLCQAMPQLWLTVIRILEMQSYAVHSQRFILGLQGAAVWSCSAFTTLFSATPIIHWSHVCQSKVNSLAFWWAAVLGWKVSKGQSRFLNISGNPFYKRLNLGQTSASVPSIIQVHVFIMIQSSELSAVHTKLSGTGQCFNSLLLKPCSFNTIAWLPS